MPRSSFFDLSAVLFLAICLAGCGGGTDVPDGQLPVFPVHGTVSYNGQPVDDATISLHSEGRRGSYARSDANGKFVLNTYAEGDGAPAGSYTVTVMKMVDVNAGGGSEAIDAERGPANYESQIPEHLSKKETSGLTVTIQPDVTNVLTISLADGEGASRVEHSTD